MQAAWPAMKIVILHGGPMAPPASPAGKPGPTGRGVTALGAGDGRWVLINMSAAVAQQLAFGGALEGHAGLPNTHAQADVRAVLLTDAQIEHVGGLIGLRGGAQIDLYATPAVFEELSTHLPVLPVLRHYCRVHWHVVPVAGDRQVASFQVEGLPQLEFTALATRATPPPHSSHHANPVTGDSIALAVRDLANGQRVFCVPGGACIGAVELEWMRQADCLLIDPHTPLAPELHTHGPGWVGLLSRLPARHKVLMSAGAHGPPQLLAAQGIAVAFDRMAIEL